MLVFILCYVMAILGSMLAGFSLAALLGLGPRFGRFDLCIDPSTSWKQQHLWGMPPTLGKNILDAHNCDLWLVSRVLRVRFKDLRAFGRRLTDLGNGGLCWWFGLRTCALGIRFEEWVLREARCGLDLD